MTAKLHTERQQIQSVDLEHERFASANRRRVPHHSASGQESPPSLEVHLSKALPRGVEIPDLNNYHADQVTSFSREYHGAEATRLIGGLHKLVQFKGGEWRSGVNIVAVEGLGLETGLHDNKANTFDDTFFVALDCPHKQRVLALRGTTYAGFDQIPEGRTHLNKLDPRFQHEFKVGELNIPQYETGRGAAVPTTDNASLPGTGMDRSGKYSKSTTITQAKIHWTGVSGDYFNDTTPVEGVNLGCPTIACNRDEFVGSITKNYLDKNDKKPFLLSIINPRDVQSKFLPRACTPEAPGY